jgi:ATP-binding cassette subfamily B protein
LIVKLADASEMAAIFRQQDIEIDTDHAPPLTISKGAISFDKPCLTYNQANARQTRLFEDQSKRLASTPLSRRSLWEPYH